MNIKKYVKEAHQTATDHGFHDEPRQNEYWLMLIITEICEVVDADRRSGSFDGMEDFLERTNVHPDFAERYNVYIKGTVAEELADICIRVFDFMGEAGIKPSTLSKIYMEPGPEFDELPLMVQCYNVIGAIIECDSQPINCKNILLMAEYWARKYNIDLEWHIRAKMEYNKLRPIYNGKRY